MQYPIASRSRRDLARIGKSDVSRDESKRYLGAKPTSSSKARFSPIIDRYFLPGRFGAVDTFSATNSTSITVIDFSTRRHAG
jgi:hypothetical protein